MARPTVCGMCGMPCGMVCGIESLTGQALCGMCGINAHPCGRVAMPTPTANDNRMRPRRNMPHTPHMPHTPCSAGRAAVRHGVRHSMYTPHAAHARSRAPVSSFSRLARKVGKGGLV